MSGMFWIALELSIPKIGLNIKLSLTVEKLDAFKFDGVAGSDNTVAAVFQLRSDVTVLYSTLRQSHSLLTRKSASHPARPVCSCIQTSISPRTFCTILRLIPDSLDHK